MIRPPELPSNLSHSGIAMSNDGKQKQIHFGLIKKFFITSYKFTLHGDMLI